MANLWTQQSGTSLGTIEETVTILNGISLPLVESGSSTFKISGQLPPGLRLSNNKIVGTPYEVARTTEFQFVLRATYNGEFEDRTFTLTVEGADAPQWVTPAGDLPVGNNGVAFILDSSIIDFQLQAIDNDLPAGDTVEYYIKFGNGQLPPNTRLTTDGRIVGIIDPLLALNRSANNGNYDMHLFDSYAYDFGITFDNGYDSFFYDSTVYDLSIPTRSPKKLNRYYEFIVTASDGDVEVDRKFKMFVVGDDFLRADNTQMKAGNGVFTADGTYLRQLFWLTPSNLGYRRANNYITLFLDVYDPAEVVGIISYRMVATNDDNTPSILPSGLELDALTGEIAGRVPYQPAVTKEYKFTVEAVRQIGDVENYVTARKTFTVTMLGEADSKITWISDSDLGTIRANIISNLSVTAETTLVDTKLIYRLISGKLPYGMSLTGEGEIVGKARQNGDSKVYRSFWKPSIEYTITDVVRQGDKFYTPVINHTSDVEFTLDAGKWEEYTYTNYGLTFIDTNTLLLDAGTTSIDRSYEFTVDVRDRFNYTVEQKTFTLKVSDPSELLYSNLYFQPMLKETQRNTFKNFISDTSIFEPSIVYRASDPNFGVQERMRMLVYAGIETKAIANYSAAIAKNHKRKRYKLGEIKSAVAKLPATNNVAYEVVYVEVIDPLEPQLGETRNRFRIKNQNAITVDSIQYHVENDNTPFGLGYTKLTIDGRNSDPQILIDDISIEIFKRTGSFLIPIENDLTIDVRGSDIDITVDLSFIDSDAMRFRPKPKENTIKADSNAVKISDSGDVSKYNSNVQNMRKNIKGVGETEAEYLPLWMLSSQPGSAKAQGYTKAIPLCYCKPGTSARLIENIKNNGFNFKQIDFEIDRYVIDSTTGNSNEQYLIFANFTFNV